MICQNASSWQCSSSNHTSSAHLLPRWRSVERRAAVGLRRGGGAAKRIRAKAEVRRLCRRRVGIKGVLRHQPKGHQPSPPKDHTPKPSFGVSADAASASKASCVTRDNPSLDACCWRVALNVFTALQLVCLCWLVV